MTVDFLTLKRSALVRYAKEKHGLNLATMKTTEIYKKLAEIENVKLPENLVPQEKKKEETNVDVEKMTPSQLAAYSRRQAMKDKTYITIHKSEGVAGTADVIVGFNGTMYRIKRGERVCVPRAVANILRDAEKTVYTQVTNDDGSTELVAETVHAYPFSEG